MIYRMKYIRITISIFMLLFIFLSLKRWDSNPTFHIIAGSGCALFFTIHFIINIKPFRAMTKKFNTLPIRTKRLYIIDLLLLILWSIAIITGYIAVPFYLNEEALHVIGRVHGISARLGCVLTLVHIFQHIKQIRAYI